MSFFAILQTGAKNIIFSGRQEKRAGIVTGFGIKTNKKQTRNGRLARIVRQVTF